MESMIETLQLAGGLIALVALGVIVWSARFPERRLWPPKPYRSAAPVLVRGLSFALLLFIAALGSIGWETLDLPLLMRFAAGPLLIALGNLVVVVAAIRISSARHRSAPGRLETGGPYRFSRNPQYLGEIAILAGWAMLSASAPALPVIALAILVLIAAPFSEEAWMQDRYGSAWHDYRARVRRYL